MRPLWVGPLTLETVTVPLRDLPPALEGCRIAQLSDFHYDGQRLAKPLLQAAIAQVNQLQPDLIALTGDFMTHSHAPMAELADHLSQLQSRCGVVAVLGNHDNHRPGNRATVLRELRRVGIQALWNQVVYPLGPDFPVVGLAEYWSRDFNPSVVFGTLASHLPRLVLAHQPDSADALTPWRVDLQLSGHTHGGQIVVPGLGIVPARLKGWYQGMARLLPWADSKTRKRKTIAHWEWAAGLHSVPHNRASPGWIYVNRGLGTYAPGRWRCPPEVTLIRLTAA
ncbi:metallophosphoesterase [Phormidium sp. FACHB-1136]|uniref:metallophosphoesterase n=1 Tax=Phormidium sp. FACHB-1136 TaxID=2692848 RepID=UPI001686294D|nr:metallophosphoesterase [Phormidium sp. FACHB-1136]MBD2424811.1 metallophosphoesterase [Phormidium sp. FACHB-1136]